MIQKRWFCAGCGRQWVVKYGPLERWQAGDPCPHCHAARVEQVIYQGRPGEDYQPTPGESIQESPE